MHRLPSSISTFLCPAFDNILNGNDEQPWTPMHDKVKSHARSLNVWPSNMRADKANPSTLRDACCMDLPTDHPLTANDDHMQPKPRRRHEQPQLQAACERNHNNDDDNDVKVVGGSLCQRRPQLPHPTDNTSRKPRICSLICWPSRNNVLLFPYT